MSLQVWIRWFNYLPFLNFKMSGFPATGLLPSWIGMLEFSLRGDFGLSRCCTVWTTDCSLPSCWKVHTHSLSMSWGPDASGQEVRTGHALMQTTDQCTDGPGVSGVVAIHIQLVAHSCYYSSSSPAISSTQTWQLFLLKILTGNKSSPCSDRNMFYCGNLCLATVRNGNLAQLAVGLCSVEVSELIRFYLIHLNLLYAKLINVASENGRMMCSSKWGS